MSCLIHLLSASRKNQARELCGSPTFSQPDEQAATQVGPVHLGLDHILLGFPGSDTPQLLLKYGGSLNVSLGFGRGSEERAEAAKPSYENDG